MDSKELRELIDVIGKSNFVTFELEQNGFKLRLEKGGGAAGAAASAAAATAPAPSALASVAAPVALPVAPAPSPAVPAAAPVPAVVAPADAGVISMTSPIVGTFYRKPNPDAPSFVDVGSRVKKGQVLCIVEAMKLMNEIEAEMDAEVVEVLVANAQPVEFGEVLFRLRPLV